MAIDRTTENRITAVINEERQKKVKKVCVVGIPLALAASAIFPLGIPIWAGGWIMAYREAKNSGCNQKVRGAAGEDRALAVLSQLPSDYTLFNQIQLPDPKSTTGYRETDFVVVGPNGVFIIENKDFRGRIVGDASSGQWEQHKTGRGGTAYVTHGRNPIRQVQGYVSILSSIFQVRGVKAWITPIVSLSRDNSMDGINSNRVKVVQGTDLCDAVLSHPGEIVMEARVGALKILEELRALSSSSSAQA